MFEPVPNLEDARRTASIEAVNSLGLLKPEAAKTIFDLSINPEGFHPRALCTNYRKQGEQIELSEKKRIGIRGNAFMSREALAEISDKGLSDPLRAHELTLLRTSFSLFRHRNALSTERMMADHPEYPVRVLYDVFHDRACAGCIRRDGTDVGENWGILPPSDCECDTAPYGLRVDVDFDAPVLLAEQSELKKATIWRRIVSFVRSGMGTS